MSIIGSNVLAGASGSGVEAYEIERSLRFHNADSSNLSQTFSSAGNRKKWTWSSWVKRSALGGTEGIFAAGTGTSDYTSLYFQSDVIKLEDYTGAGTVSTTEVFKDPGAFFHLIVAVDTTLTTAADRVKFYINGSASTTSGTWAQDTQTRINNNVAHRIGALYGHTAGNGLNGYLADCIFVDGSALSPSDLGEDDSDGVWQPKDPSSLTFGTNGFRLNFSDNTNTTTIAEDSSGNDNDFTSSNISVTAGSGNDSMLDSPTNVAADSGNNSGNYCTWNPLTASTYTPATANLLNGNLEASGNKWYFGTMAFKTGKWYWEISSITNSGVGVADSASYMTDSNRQSVSVVLFSGAFQGIGTQPTAFSYSSSDVLGFALDADANTLAYYKNGTLQGTVTGLTADKYWTPFVAWNSSSSTAANTANFGQRAFSYTPPTGFKSLCTENLSDTTVVTSGSYTGNGVSNGPFVFTNGVPSAMSIGGSAVTFGSQINKLSNGFKLRHASVNNADATSFSYSVTTAGAAFKKSRAQTN